MRKLGYILFGVGFLWVFFVAMEVGPMGRAMLGAYIANTKTSSQQVFSHEDMVKTYAEAAYGVAHFAQWSLIGCLLLFASGIILSVTEKRVSPKPQVVSEMDRQPPRIGER
jgi:hypothetical protein